MTDLSLDNLPTPKPLVSVNDSSRAFSERSDYQVSSRVSDRSNNSDENVTPKAKIHIDLTEIIKQQENEKKRNKWCCFC